MPASVDREQLRLDGGPDLAPPRLSVRGALHFLAAPRVADLWAVDGLIWHGTQWTRSKRTLFPSSFGPIWM